MKQGRYVRVSEDHKPDRPDERRAVEARGGQVIFRGTYRVCVCLHVCSFCLYTCMHALFLLLYVCLCEQAFTSRYPHASPTHVILTRHTSTRKHTRTHTHTHTHTHAHTHTHTHTHRWPDLQRWQCRGQ